MNRNKSSSSCFKKDPSQTTWYYEWTLSQISIEWHFRKLNQRPWTQGLTPSYLSFPILFLFLDRVQKQKSNQKEVQNLTISWETRPTCLLKLSNRTFWIFWLSTSMQPVNMKRLDKQTLLKGTESFKVKTFL